MHLSSHDVENLDVHVEITILADMGQSDACFIGEGIGIVIHLREEQVVVDDKPQHGFGGVVLRVPGLEFELVCAGFEVSNGDGDAATSEVVECRLEAVVQDEAVVCL